MKNDSVIDVIIIGAGQAGLSTSYLLKKNNINHVVLERRQIGDSWMRRWDSFYMNSSNMFNLLPDESLDAYEREMFISGKQFAARLQKYADDNLLPVMTGCNVVSVKVGSHDTGFDVVLTRDGELQTLHAKQIVIAAGGHMIPVIPKISQEIPSHIFQVHSDEYRNPKQLPDGAVLVIGSATSGVQIAEELALAGRKVFLSTSAVPRVPRRYRGKDCIEWMAMMKFFDKPTAQAEEFELHLKAPLMSGLGEYGHTISLQNLQKLGVELLGYLDQVTGDEFNFKNNLADNLAFGDGFSTQVKGGIDQFIAAACIDAPAPVYDAADVNVDPNDYQNPITSLNAKDNHITSVIWSTGFTMDMNWIELPVLDDRKWPVHNDGISPYPNLYFMGLPWQRNLKSSLIYGTSEDAQVVTAAILKIIMHRKQ